jgi:transposase
MLSELSHGITLDSVRLNRYYSSSYVDSFDKITRVFMILKKNVTLNGSWKWRETMKKFVTNTIRYLGAVS